MIKKECGELMNLVFVEDNQVVTDSLTVAEMFGKDHGNVLKDIRKQAEYAGEEFAQVNFYGGSYLDKNNQSRPKFNLTEEAFALVVFSYNTKEAVQTKIKFIKEFKSMREYIDQKLQPSYTLPSTFKEALYMLAESVDENDKLKQQIENDREKVVLANAITTSDEGLLIEAAAKYMRQNGVNIGRNRLFRWLRGQGYLINRKGREWNMPTQKSLNQGLMKIHCQLYFDYDGELKTQRQVVVTGKGLLFFINKFLRDGQLSLRLES